MDGTRSDKRETEQFVLLIRSALDQTSRDAAECWKNAVGLGNIFLIDITSKKK